MQKITHLLHIFSKEKSLQLCLEKTKELRTSLEISDMKELSPKGKQLRELFASFGPAGMRWAEVHSIIMDEDLTISDMCKIIPAICFACIVPKVVFSGYRPGATHMIAIIDQKDFKCLDIAGICGDYYSHVQQGSRPASDKEIVEYVEEVFARISNPDVYERNA